jgi:hypothetical protein
MSEVSHEQIYQRLVEVETKVDRIDANTKGLVDAINAMQGAMKVLGWVASAAKPLMWFGLAITAIGVAWQNFKSHF